MAQWLGGSNMRRMQTLAKALKFMMQDKMVFPKIRKIFSPDIDKEQIFDYNISNS